MENVERPPGSSNVADEVDKEILAECISESQIEAEKQYPPEDSVTGILTIIEHGLQQFVLHLNPWTMESIAFPLNRAYEWGQSQAQPESLKLIDLGSRSKFAVF